MTDAWEEIYRKEREIDEIRKRLSIETDIEVLASKAVERCVDISREIAKGMRRDMPEIIDFGYISEKYEKLRTDLEELSREIRRGKTPTNDILRRAGYIKEPGHSTINHRLDEAIRKIELTHDLLLEAWSAGEYPKGRAIKGLADLLGQALNLLQSLRED